MTEIICRPAVYADLPGIARIENDAFTDPWSKNALEDSLRQPCTVISAAEKSGEIIGYAVAYISMDEAEIVKVAVARGFRRMGAGRRLLIDITARCRAAGVRDFILEVRSGNEAALRLYEEAGFERLGVRRDFYGKPKEDAVVMRLGRD